MPKIIQYDVIGFSDLKMLIDEINRRIQLEWQPHGNFVVTIDKEGVMIFTQPMVRYEEQRSGMGLGFGTTR